MLSITMSSLPTEQATQPQPVSRLLALYGTPPVIVTEYTTRQDPDRLTPARQVMCPRCRSWQALAHNSHCTGCLIRLAHVVVPAEVAR